jgi:hypothetical protein
MNPLGSWRSLTKRLSRRLAAADEQRPGSQQPASDEQTIQVLLRLQYQQIVHLAMPLPELPDVEFRCYSQNGEDGILLYLFSLVGATNRKVVEICAGSGIECNAANLLINHGWQGLLVEGDPAQVAAGRTFYANHPNTRFSPPAWDASWVTAENVNSLISGHGVTGDIDLLSLDVDGVDYWIWRAIDCIRPRVVVLEFNGLLGPDKRLTIPYDPGFRLDFSRQPYKCGASLAAFASLGRERGYRLVGVQSLGFNAFFVQAGLGQDVLRELSPQECFASTTRLSGYNPAWLSEMFKDGQRWEEV